MNLISVFEELDRLYESDELETVAADEATETAELEEGIFGTKKDSADFRNKTAEFSRIASSVVGKPLVNVANDMCSLLGRAISEYKTHFDEKDNHQMSSGSRSNHFNTKANFLLVLCFLCSCCAGCAYDVIKSGVVSGCVCHAVIVVDRFKCSDPVNLHYIFNCCNF